MNPAELPVFAELGRIVQATRGGGAILVAPPGSGKTTLVPGAVLDDLEPIPLPSHPLRGGGQGEGAARSSDRLLAGAGQVLLVQPRRIAARSVARRIAHLRRSDLGGEVGYQIRFENVTGPATRLIVATTGILLRRLVDDLSLPGIAAVVLDEFHERSLELDLSLGMLVRLRETIRPDLRIIVMSATLRAATLSRLLPDLPVIEVPGRTFPVEIHYTARRSLDRLEHQVGAAVLQAWEQTTGDVLVFLPGVGEIARAEEYLEQQVRLPAALFRLHGEMSSEAQDRVWESTSRRKVILATNIAETSLTLEGVTAVVDSGLARSMHTDPAVGLPRLVLGPISRASAEQRAGRAGRVGPGKCWRLWEAAAHAARPEYEIPEVLRGELSGAVLQLLHWGERDLAAFPWVDPPPPSTVESALVLLQRLGAIDGSQQLTADGLRMVGMPVHPRLARLLLTADRCGARSEAAIAAGLLSERDPFRVGRDEARRPRDRQRYRTHCDVADRVQWLLQFARSQGDAGAGETQLFTAGAGAAAGNRGLPPMPHLHRPTAQAILRTAQRLRQSFPGASASTPSAAGSSLPIPSLEHCLSLAILSAFPDRVAKLRAGSHDRGILVGGRGVRIDGQSSSVRPDSLFVCVELNDSSGDATARWVTSIAANWLPEHLCEQRDELFFNPSRGQVEARRRNYYLDLLLDETPVEIVDRSAATELLARHAGGQLERILPAADDPAQRFRRRLAWLAAQAPDLQLPCLDDESIRSMLPEWSAGQRSLAELRSLNWLSLFQHWLGYERAGQLDRLAPAEWTAPSGSRLAIEYELNRPPSVAVRIQEIFGLAATPRILNNRVPLNLELLGPNYRPQQRTNDLESFWKNTYPEIKKELRRRYPKHAWPDDPFATKPIRSGLKRDMH